MHQKVPPIRVDFKHVRKFAVEHLKKIQIGGPSIGCSSSTLPSTPSPSPPLSPSTSQFKNRNHQKQPTELITKTKKKNFFNLTRNDPPLFSDVYGIEMSPDKKDTSTESEALTIDFLEVRPKYKPKINVQRDVLDQETLIKQTGYRARDKSVLYGIQEYWGTFSFFGLFTGIFPILEWLPKYHVRQYLIGDIIAGFTVAIMNIPHGMAYGILAGLSASNGLYMAIFPVLVYLCLGTSKHISIGTFAVISIMTHKVVHTHAADEHFPRSQEGQETFTPVQVATATAIMSGFIQLIMSFLRLGTLASLLSTPLINGFTTAAAIHVIMSQVKDIFGVSIPRYKGAFKIVYSLIDMVKEVPSSNLMAIKVSAVVIVFMVIMNEFLKPCVAKRTRFPIPAELIAVVGGTLASQYLDLNTNYGVKLLGTIPLGLPSFEIPPVQLLPIVAVDSIAIAIVSFSIVMSMGLTFANKHTYDIFPNQELFALSMGNFVGGCFSCLPMACSLSRSVIQDQTGGKTQIASLVSALLLLATVLWIGPFFSPLPRCVLSAVIIVALKPMIMQVTQIKRFAQQGKLELLTWVATFLGVVFIDIDVGLFIGICMSLLSLYVKGLKPYGQLLGTMADLGNVYVVLDDHEKAVEIPQTKIFQYTGSLNFATRNHYKKTMYRCLEIDSQKLRRASLIALELMTGDIRRLNPFRALILDFSRLGHIDIAGCRTLTEIKNEVSIFGVRVFIAGAADRVYDTIVHSMALGEGPFEVFPTLHDAVVYSTAVLRA